MKIFFNFILIIRVYNEKCIAFNSKNVKYIECESKYLRYDQQFIEKHKQT